MKIFIDTNLVLLTRGRVNNQILLSTLHPTILKEVHIVCHPGEKLQHIKNWGDKVASVVEYKGSFVGEARQWCIENFSSENIIFMEDNIKLHIRKDKPDFGNIREFGLYELDSSRFTLDHVLEYQLNLFDDMIEKLNSGYGLVGISQRFGNNRISEDMLENCRIFGFWGLNRFLYNTLPAKISDVVYREDFYLILKFLLEGIKVCNLYTYAFNKQNGVNSEGGCSTYRTPEETNNNVEWMCKEFPGIVKSKENKKISWKGYSGIALDVVIQWKKAYEIGVKNKNNN
jgi:hypothetical protein